jgi:RNAse (barnase) inhibitor barstar
MNWDAFWDSITGLVEMPDRIVFAGWDELAMRLPADAATLSRLLDDYRLRYRPGFAQLYE